MFDYNSQLIAYEADCVNLPQAVKDKLRDHREANRTRLKRNRPSKLRLNDDHFIPQGSMAVGTTVQDENNAYDIDDGVWFYAEDLVDDSGHALTAGELQTRVCEALRDTRFNKPPEIHHNCIRVFYAEGHHVDVPCYRRSDPDSDDERQELASSTGFAISDPTEINRWFFERVESLNKERPSAGTQFRIQVRLIKRFARSRGADWDMPNGLKLTMLVEECLPTFYARDDEAFYWLLSNLQTRLAASLEVENRAQTKVPRDKLTKTANDANMREMQRRIDEALSELSVLHTADCRLKDARAAWDWVFQTDGYFDAYDKDPENARALFEKAALIKAGLAATGPTGLIIPASATTIAANRGHQFYGDAS